MLDGTCDRTWLLALVLSISNVNVVLNKATHEYKTKVEPISNMTISEASYVKHKAQSTNHISYEVHNSSKSIWNLQILSPKLFTNTQWEIKWSTLFYKFDPDHLWTGYQHSSGGLCKAFSNGLHPNNQTLLC